MTEHLITDHGKPIEYDNPNCYFCQKTFDSNQLMQTHCQNKHRDIDGMFPCNNCKKRYLNLQTHHEHVNNCQKGVDKELDEHVDKIVDKSVDKSVGKSVDNTQAYITAMRHTQRLHSCKNCGKKYKNYMSYQNHIFNCAKKFGNELNVDKYNPQTLLIFI